MRRESRYDHWRSSHYEVTHVRNKLKLVTFKLEANVYWRYLFSVLATLLMVAAGKGLNDTRWHKTGFLVTWFMLVF